MCVILVLICCYGRYLIPEKIQKLYCMCRTLLIQLVTFFARLKISTCVCKFRVDLLIWSVTFSREKIEIILHVQNTVDPLIQPVTFLPYWKFSICVCHFGVDWLIWPVTLSKDNIEIILHVRNPVDPLIQLVTFFARLKISTCVCKFRVD